MASQDRTTHLVQTLKRLEHEKGEANGLLQILKAKLQAAEEENLDLCASMALFETETRLESETKERELQSRIAALESKLALVSDKLQNTERGKLRATKMVEELQQKQLVEQKRFDAERRLMATRRRKHESFLAATQSVTMSPNHLQQVLAKPAVTVIETAVQTEQGQLEEEKQDTKALQDENACLISYLLTEHSRELVALLNGTVSGGDLGEEANHGTEGKDRPQHLRGGNSSTPTQSIQNSSENSFSDSFQHSSSGIPFSQSVFSQIGGRASIQAPTSLLSGAIETKHAQSTLALNRAQELYTVMGEMVAGDVSVVALAPVFMKYLAAQTELEAGMIRSILRVLYAVMHRSARFQHFLLVRSSLSDNSVSCDAGSQKNPHPTRYSRIASSGLQFTSLDDFLSARSVDESFNQKVVFPSMAAENAAQEKPLCCKLMSELCKVIKTNGRDPAIVNDGLCVLSLWVHLGRAHPPSLTLDLNPLLASKVIPSLCLAPNSSPVVQAQALGLLSQIISIPEVFTEMEAESKKSLLFNRCAKMLSSKRILSHSEATNVRALQHQIVTMMLSIITSFPSKGIRFVLESTHGLSSDSDGYRSIIYYLVQLLHQETFDARTSGNPCEKQTFVTNHARFELVRNALALLGLLSRYVDLRHELGGYDDVHLFLAVLYFLSDVTHDRRHDDSVHAAARALIGMVNMTSQ